MKVGISSSCFYPLVTEQSLLEVARLGVQTAEVFISCATELNPPYFDEILRVVRDYSLDLVSLHPFGALDTQYLFSNYERRKDAAFELYKRHFERMAQLHSQIFVLHGVRKQTPVDEEFYFERFAELQATANQFGVTVAQENVERAMSGDLGFLKRMCGYLGDTAKFVLDIKQATRSGYAPTRFVEALGSHIVHIHASDNLAGVKAKDCLPVGQGDFDFDCFFRKLRAVGFDGAVIVELYRSGFDQAAELLDSAKRLQQHIERSDDK
ncbi:MAG: sugar phosphate isomerase/epimerase [Oscillospiraceae bacterium]|jgi:sugar phosphate isomerase/epimerase|nr:sugar phosphate isomerase/epimerase [Oscillospiraceae bacterium]